MTTNSYANLDAPLEEVLHGSARLHVHLGRCDEAGITTRGWSYNQLVSGIVALNGQDDPGCAQRCAIETLWDTLDGVCEIGPRAVLYLHELASLGEGVDG